MLGAARYRSDALSQIYCSLPPHHHPEIVPYHLNLNVVRTCKANSVTVGLCQQTPARDVRLGIPDRTWLALLFFPSKPRYDETVQKIPYILTHLIGSHRIPPFYVLILPTLLAFSLFPRPVLFSKVSTSHSFCIRLFLRAD